MNQTTQTIKESNITLGFSFRCGYCGMARVTEDSKVLGFEDGHTRVCSYCVKVTEEYRAKLPIIEE